MFEMLVGGKINGSLGCDSRDEPGSHFRALTSDRTPACLRELPWPIVAHFLIVAGLSERAG